MKIFWTAMRKILLYFLNVRVRVIVRVRVRARIEKVNR